MKKKRLFCLVVFLVLFSSISFAAQIDPEVEKEIRKHKEVEVIIKLKDGTLQKGVMSGMEEDEKQEIVEEIREDVKEKQEKVIEKISEKDLKVKHKHAVLNSFSGKITKKGLSKLKRDPNVEAVYIDTIYQADLLQSVPQINADNVWGIRLNGVNITGEGETICILDTGVDYTHEALGACNIERVILDGAEESYTLESDHNYSSSYDHTWEINMPGYHNIAVHFKNISTESNYDLVMIYDNNSRIIGSFSGSHTDLWSPYSQGDTIYVRLLTDLLIEDYGFFIDKIINGTTNTSYDWSNCTKVIGGWDFVNSDADPYDDQGHGTHCAGIAASDLSTRKGVAPDAKILALKVLDDGDPASGTTSDVMAGIDYCINRSAEYNISVISMSLGGGGPYNSYCNSDPLADSINNAAASGIFVAVSSGNSGWTNGINSPACIESATPVGSVGDGSGGAALDVISGFTNRGAILDLLAPGSSIISSVPGGYSAKSGTSMAAPHAAGTAALIKQFMRLWNDTDIGASEIEDLLNDTGRQIYDSGTSRYYSRIDAYSAIVSLDTIDPAVEFVDPTPANDSKISDRNVIVNVSVSDNLSIEVCLIDWNGTNNSMTKLEEYCNYNTITDFSEYSYRVFANDSAGNWGSTELRILNITNIAPVLAVIENITVNESDVVEIIANATDDDALTYRINDSRFNQSGNIFMWQTDENDSGLYVVRVNVTDGNDSDYQDVWIRIVDLGDLDYDGYKSISYGGNDCNDGNSGINPGTTEICGNGIDEDCSGSDLACSTGNGGSSGGSRGGGGGGSVDTSAYKNIEVFGRTRIEADEKVKFSIEKEIIAFTEISFKALVVLAKVNIRVEALETFSDEIENAYQYLKVTTIRMTEGSYDGAEIRFKIDNKWLDGYDKDTVTLHRYEDDGWNAMETKLYQTDANYHHYRAEIPGFSYFAINAEKKKDIPNIEETAEEGKRKLVGIEEEKPTIIVEDLEKDYGLYIMTAIAAMIFLAGGFEYIYLRRKKGKKGNKGKK